MARPKKSETELRTCWAHLRYTPAEDLAIRMNAAAAGLSIAEFCRRRTLSQPVIPPTPKADRQLLAELNSIGNNVNQIARDVNSGRQYNCDVEAVMDQLARVLDKVVQLYDL